MIQVSTKIRDDIRYNLGTWTRMFHRYNIYRTITPVLGRGLSSQLNDIIGDMLWGLNGTGREKG